MTDASGLTKPRAHQRNFKQPMLIMPPAIQTLHLHPPTQPPHRIQGRRTRPAPAQTLLSRRSMHRRTVLSTTKLQMQAPRCSRSSPARPQTSRSQRSSSAAHTMLKKLMVLSKTTSSAISTRRAHHLVLARRLQCFTHDHSFPNWTWAVDICGMLYTTSSRSPPTSRQGMPLKYHALHLIR